MEIIRSWHEVNRKNNPPAIAVALGNFDGVHKGHKALIERTIAAAKKDGLKSAVFTFSNHPRDLLSGKKTVKNILRNEEKEKIIGEMGIDILFHLPFTEHLMQMEAERYVKELIIGTLHARVILAGFNHHFGHFALGNADLLRKTAKEEAAEKGVDMRVEILDPVLIGDEVVSSSLIRTLISAGQVERCPLFLGRWYSIGGTVHRGNQLGRSLGYPTSNLAIDDHMVSPPNGVYVTACRFDGRLYPGVTDVGVRPTVGGDVRRVETHIFHFDKLLYGKYIEVLFLKKMRDEVRFDSMEELSRQIMRDAREAQKYHAEHPMQASV